jgi:hypothetical protein
MEAEAADGDAKLRKAAEVARLADVARKEAVARARTAMEDQPSRKQAQAEAAAREAVGAREPAEHATEAPPRQPSSSDDDDDEFGSCDEVQAGAGAGAGIGGALASVVRHSKDRARDASPIRLSVQALAASGVRRTPKRGARSSLFFCFVFLEKVERRFNGSGPRPTSASWPSLRPCDMTTLTRCLLRVRPQPPRLPRRRRSSPTSSLP